MTHPNIVKYYKTFLEGDYSTSHCHTLGIVLIQTVEKSPTCSLLVDDKLYIVMELIEGVPLAEHFNSLRDKQQKFTEDRIWNIFIQVKLFNLVF